MQNIQMNGIEKDGLKQKIANDFNIPIENIDDGFLNFIQEFINSRGSSEEYFKIQKEIPSTPPDTTSFLIPRTYYYISVKKTTWILIGLLLDILITKGIATTFLSLLGIIGQSVAKLSIKNGEVCCYYEGISLKKEGIKKFDENHILNRITGKSCLYPDFGCIYNKNGTCSIRFEDLQQVFQGLKDKAVISRTEDNRWSVEL